MGLYYLPIVVNIYIYGDLLEIIQMYFVLIPIYKVPYWQE